MNRPIRRIGAVFAILLLAMIANVTFIQVFKAADYRDRPGNQRQLLAQYDRERGPIVVATDAAARSIETGDTLRYQRVYSNGELYAPITGFYSLVYGATGLERTENKILNGSSDLLFVDRTKQLFAGRQIQGGSVVTTINPDAQIAAYEGLGTKVGAVVAIEPSTGKILASAQSPSFDPNILSTHKPADIRTYYESLTANPDKPLLNRPIVSLNPPGSTFKLVTTAAALASGNYTPDSLLPGPKTYQLPNSTKRINNWNHSACGPGGMVTLRQALAISCNTAFAWLGNELGADALRTQAQLMGFDSRFELPLRAARSTFPEDPDKPQTSLSAIGQYEVRATALQMAMVGAAIGNKGVVMNPFMVQEIRGPDLSVLQTTQPSVFKQAMTAANAATETDLMVNVVNHGTGSNARISGIDVAGKTGTAQTGNDRPSVAWFVSFALAVNPKVAVAVCIEQAGTSEISGNGLAAPIAKKVMQAILKQS